MAEQSQEGGGVTGEEDATARTGANGETLSMNIIPCTSSTDSLGTARIQ